MDMLRSETCWAHKKWNKIASDIKLVFYSSSSEDLIYILAEIWSQAKNKVVFMHKQLTNKHFSFYKVEGDSIQLWMNYDFETGIINVSECPEIVQTLHYVTLHYVTTFLSSSSLSWPLLAFQ